MKVRVKLFASPRKFGPEEQTMEIPDEATLASVVARLALPGEIPLLKIVNGEVRQANHPLREGDEIALFPPIAGGQTLMFR